MSIMTKKKIESIEYLEINKCKLVAYKDFLALKEILEEAVEVIEFYEEEAYNWDHYDISKNAEKFLRKYEGEG